MESLIGEGKGHKMKYRTHHRAYMVLELSGAFPSSVFNSGQNLVSSW